MSDRDYELMREERDSALSALSEARAALAKANDEANDLTLRAQNAEGRAERAEAALDAAKARNAQLERWIRDEPRGEALLAAEKGRIDAEAALAAAREIAGNECRARCDLQDAHENVKAALAPLVAFVRTFARALLGDEDGGVRDWMRESGDGALLEEWHAARAMLTKIDTCAAIVREQPETDWEGRVMGMTDTLGHICPHGKYERRCVECGAEPLGASVQPLPQWRAEGRERSEPPESPSAALMSPQKEVLTLTALREANAVRQKEWDRGDVITLEYRGNELAGEVGEACNVVKKLARERLGIRGSRATTQQLADELADVVICVDLVAMQAGIDLGAAVVSKFNATSEKNSLQTRLLTSHRTAAKGETK